MQLSATIIIAFLFSLLSLRVLGHPHRVIRPRPGSPHRGSGLGGGGIIPFSSKTHTKRSLSASTPNSPVRPGVASVPATLTPQTPFESTPLLSTYLSLHNELRKQYAAKPLSWSTTLASAAQQWASNCQYGHSSMTYGENIAAGTAENFTAQDAFDIWGANSLSGTLVQPNTVQLTLSPLISRNSYGKEQLTSVVQWPAALVYWVIRVWHTILFANTNLRVISLANSLKTYNKDVIAWVNLSMTSCH